MMKKTQAIEMLGGTVPSAAKALGVSYQAVNKWPDELPLRISDRVLGAFTRQQNPELANSVPAHPATPAAPAAQAAQQGVANV